MDGTVVAALAALEGVRLVLAVTFSEGARSVLVPAEHRFAKGHNLARRAGESYLHWRGVLHASWACLLCVICNKET